MFLCVFSIFHYAWKKLLSAKLVILAVGNDETP